MASGEEGSPRPPLGGTVRAVSLAGGESGAPRENNGHIPEKGRDARSCSSLFRKKNKRVSKRMGLFRGGEGKVLLILLEEKGKGRIRLGRVISLEKKSPSGGGRLLPL